MTIFDVVLIRHTTTTERTRLQIEAETADEAAVKALDSEWSPDLTWSERFTEPPRVEVVIGEVDALADVEEEQTGNS